MLLIGHSEHHVEATIPGLVVTGISDCTPAVVCHAMDRLARNLDDLRKVFELRAMVNDRTNSCLM